MFPAGLRALGDRLDAGRRRDAGGAVPISATRDRATAGASAGPAAGADAIRRSGEQGFVLLEEIVAISLLIIVMAALATFFLTVTQSTTYERAKQSAVQLSNTQMNLLRGVPAADLTLGRKSVAQFASAPTVVQPALATMTATDDATTTQTVQPTTTATVNNTVYTITNYLGTCIIPTGAGANAPCVKAGGSVTTGVPFLRAVVAVTWPGIHCSAGLCSYVTASLISAAADPQFVLNQAPPAVPLVQNPGNQVSTIGAPDSLTLALQANTGVAPTTWTSTTLPAGLSMTMAGVISGTPTTLTNALSVTVTATDAFLRTATATFTWSVAPPPTVTGLATPFITTAGATIAVQSLPYTCPTSSCTYTVAGAPAGVGLATTAAGPFAAIATVTATSGTIYLGGSVPSSTAPSGTAYANDVASQQAIHYWRLDEASGVTAADSIPGPLTSPMTEVGGLVQGAPGAILSNTDSASAFDGVNDYATTQTAVAAPTTWTESVWFKTATAGGRGGFLMGMEDTTGTTGNDDRVLYVNSSGRLTFGVYLAGNYNTVTTPGAYNDGQWHQAVGMLSPAGQSFYVDGRLVGTNATVTAGTNFTAYWHLGAGRMMNWPGWTGNAASDFFPGTLDDASVYASALSPTQVQAQYSDSGRVPFSLSVTPTDTSATPNANGTPNTAAWTVMSPPTVMGLPTPFTTTAGATIASQPLAYSCPTGGCTLTLTGAPAGVGIAATTGGTVSPAVAVTNTSGYVYLGGTVTGAAGNYTPTVTIADTASSVSSAASASWTVYGAPTIINATTPFTTTAGGTVASQTLPYTCPSSACTYTLTGAPTGIGLATSTTGTPSTSPVAVTASSGNLYLRGTVAASNAPASTAYVADVRSQGASNYWRLDDTTGTSGADSIGTLPLTEQAGVGHGAAGGVASNSDTASTFDGSPVDGSASTTTAVTGPQTFSESVWFRTTTTSAGWIMGFANTVTGISNNYDRMIYMDNGGYIHFGTCGGGCTNGPTVVTSTRAYNDGQWHQAVGTLSSAGLSFYVDGSLAATNPAVTSAQVYNGYWRLGGNNLDAYPGNITSKYFAGTIDDASVYPTALTATQIQQQYADSGRIPFSVLVTPQDTPSGVGGTASQAAWTVYSPPAVAGLTTPFATAAGASITSQPLPYSCPSGSCTFTVAGAPAGIGLAATATGTPSTTPLAVSNTSGTIFLTGTVSSSASIGSSTVTVTPADVPSGATGTGASASWTIAPATPTITGLTTPFSTTRGATVANQVLTYTCPTSACSFALAGAPSGVGLSTAASGGTPATPVTVSNTSGSIYLRGTVSASAAIGTSTVTVTPSAGSTAGIANSATWTVGAIPTITGLTTPLATTAGATIANQNLPYTCPSGSCLFTVAGAPAGIGLAATAGGAASSSQTITGSTSGTLYLRGTVDPAAGTTSAYTNDVIGQGATDYWRLDDPAGSTGADSVGSAPLTESAGVGRGSPGAIATSPDTASTFDGSALGTARSQVSVTAPSTFTESIWFRTTTTQGGQLIGFGDSRTDARSSAHDRQLYMDTSGRVIFGVSPTSGVTSVVVSPGSYNDGAWHQAVATMRSGSGGGQSLYLDGRLVGSPTTITTTVPYNGYWRLGGDDLSAWPAGPSSNFAGTLDEAAVYATTALTAAQVQQQWADARAAAATVTVTPTDAVSGMNGTANQAAWTISPAPMITGLTSPFATNSNAVVSNQTLPYSCPSGACTIALSGAPSGIGISTSSTGTTSSSVAVTAATGYVYLRGTVGSSASGSYALAVTPTDTSTATVGTPSQATWTVNGLPTVTGLPPSASVNVGQVVANIPLAYTCPSRSCLFTIGGGLSGIGLDTDTAGGTAPSVSVTNTSGSIYIRGTVAAPAGSYTLSVTPTDSLSGGSGTPNQAVVTVIGPTVSGLTTPFTVRQGAVVSNQTLAYTCPSSACTYSLAGAPAGVGLFTSSTSGTAASSVAVTAASGNIYLRGTVSSSATVGGTTVTVTPTDTATTVNGPAASAAWTVTANTKPSIAGLTTPFTTTAGAAISSQALSYSCPTSACTYTVAGAPSGVGLDTDNIGAVTNSVSVTTTSGTIYLRGTVSGSAPTSTKYPADVVSQGATDYWRLGDATPGVGADSIGKLGLTEQPGITQGTSGVITGSTDTASTFDGSSVDGSATTTGLPITTGVGTAFSVEVWFTTTTTAGGKMLGYETTQTGTSGTSDRQLYLDSAGHVEFGTNNDYNTGVRNVIGSASTYRDGLWHQAVGTYSSSTGLALYVDGALVGTNTAAVNPAQQVGYWRLGGGTLSGWPGNPAATSNYFSGTLDEASVYASALTASQVLTQFNDATAGSYSVTVTPTDTSTSTNGTVATAPWTLFAPPTVSGLAGATTTAQGSVVSRALAYTCPSSSCSYSIAGAPTGVGLATTSTGAAAASVSPGAMAGTIYVVGTVGTTTTPWNLTVTPADTPSGVSGSAAASTWTVRATPATTAYASDVTSLASNYWRLGDSTAGTGADSKGSTALSEAAGVTQGSAGAILTNTANTAAAFSGTATGTASTTASASIYQTAFSLEIWFKTTTAAGGKLLGDESATGSGATGTSYRQLYLDAGGHVDFGEYDYNYPGHLAVAASAGTYNDGQWHQAVATFSSSIGVGLTLYVDGVQVASNTGALAPYGQNGYWRIGGGNVIAGGWPGNPAATSNYFAGTLDEASVYASTLTLAQIQQQYLDSGRTP